MIPAALLTVVVIGIAIVITSQQHQNSNGPQITLPTSTQHREPTYGPQVTLPFTRTRPNSAHQVAVDTAGDLYVTERATTRVLKLAAGSATQSVLPFTGLNNPGGVAVDTAGNVYVTDGTQQPGAEAGGGLGHPDRAAVHRPQRRPAVWRWIPPATSTSPTCEHNRVLKLAAGSTTQTVLPFTGLNEPYRVWRWTPPATSTSPTAATIGC